MPQCYRTLGRCYCDTHNATHTNRKNSKYHHSPPLRGLKHATTSVWKLLPSFSLKKWSFPSQPPCFIWQEDIAEISKKFTILSLLHDIIPSGDPMESASWLYWMCNVGNKVVTRGYRWHFPKWIPCWEDMSPAFYPVENSWHDVTYYILRSITQVIASLPMNSLKSFVLWHTTN